jgi:hypothetical protein
MSFITLLAQQFMQDFIQTTCRTGLESTGAPLLEYPPPFTQGLPVKLDADIPQVMVFTVQLDFRPNRLKGTKRLLDRHGVIAQDNHGKPDRGRLNGGGIEVIALTAHCGGTIGLPFSLYGHGSGQ